MVRFQADADLNQIIVAALVRKNPLVDFRAASVASLNGLTDAQVLELAAANGRVLVTHDALHEVAAVDEVLLAQGQEVAPVGAFRGGARAKPSRGKGSRWATRPRVWIDAKRTSASGSRCWPVWKPSRASGRILRKVSQDCCRMRPRSARRQPRPQRARCCSMDAAAARWRTSSTAAQEAGRTGLLVGGPRARPAS